MSPWRCVAPPIPEPWLVWADGSVDVVTATGSEAIDYLQGQLAQDVEGLAVGQCRYSLLLQPQGKMVALTRVLRTGADAIALVADAGAGEAVAARLERFKLRTDCRFELTTRSVTRIRASEPAMLLALGDSVDETGAARVVPLSWPTLPGADVLIEVDPAELGGAVSSADLVAAADIGAGIPRHGTEITDNTIPAEIGVIDFSVDFAKGCYVGQELVARMDSRGNMAPRRLRSVCGRGPVPDARAAVDSGGEEIGHLTRVAPVGDGWVGLASIRRAALAVTDGSVQGSAVRIAEQLET